MKIVFNHFIKSETIIKNPVSKVKFLQENNENFVVITSEEEKLYLMAARQINGREAETATFSSACVLSFTSSLTGFRPRHLNRWT